MKRPETKPDVIVQELGSIILFKPRTAKSRAWFDRNVSRGWFTGRRQALPIEARYCGNVLEGLERAGFSFKLDIS